MTLRDVPGEEEEEEEEEKVSTLPLQYTTLLPSNSTNKSTGELSGTDGVSSWSAEGGREGGRRGKEEEGEKVVNISVFSTDLSPHFITMIPLSLADDMSILSTPVPARPISLSCLPAAMTSEVTFVAERTISPS